MFDDPHIPFAALEIFQKGGIAIIAFGIAFLAGVIINKLFHFLFSTISVSHGIGSTRIGINSRYR